MSDTGNRISRIYSHFRGVDFRGDEINLVRSPDSLNVWKDYKETESIRTRPGLELVRQFKSTIHGMYFFDGNMIVHSGTSLYDNYNGKWMIRAMVKDAPGVGFVSFDPISKKSAFYYKDGLVYMRAKEGEESWNNVAGYVPTTSIARKPQSGGTHHEDVNMLQPRRINTFLPDGNGKEFWLDAEDIDTSFKPIVKKTELVNNKVVETVLTEGTDYTVDYAKGTITFKNVPSAPLTDGQDYISVEFSKTVEKYAPSIMGCTMAQVFDNRVFVSGNPDYPNVVWHCSLEDPTYFSDTDYYREGMDEAQVKGMVAGNNALWVFREPSASNTNVFYHTPAVDDTHGKVYPSTHSSVTTGCVGKAINFNDDIVFFSERGMEGISGDVTTEQVVAHRSTLVDRKMISNPAYKDMVLAEWEGYLLVFIGNEVYLADSRTAFTNEDHYEYDWFYWRLEKEVTCATVHDGVLYVGTKDGGVYTLTDNTANVESYWVTPKDKFNYPHMQKTTNKRGCVAEATGDIAVYAKLEDTDFELIGEYNDVKDYFVSRIKRKKFKDIQLKFHSNTRFSLETVTLEAWIGGYIKR